MAQGSLQLYTSLSAYICPVADAHAVQFVIYFEKHLSQNHKTQSTIHQGTNLPNF